MKVITVRNLKGAEIVAVNDGLTLCGDIEADDGHHTFDELYEHRHVLFIALLKAFWTGERRPGLWCSKLHHDGTMFDGWFIVGIDRSWGRQITYHLPIRYWDEVIKWARQQERAPEWDQHTSQEALDRLRSL